MYYIFKITNIQIIVCVGNYYDLNSHKISILAFVQQMVSGGRGDTMLGCAEYWPGGETEDAVAVGKIILQRMSWAIKSKIQSNYTTSNHRLKSSCYSFNLISWTYFL